MHGRAPAREVAREAKGYIGRNEIGRTIRNRKYVESEEGTGANGRAGRRVAAVAPERNGHSRAARTAMRGQADPRAGGLSCRGRRSQRNHRGFRPGSSERVARSSACISGRRGAAAGPTSLRTLGRGSPSPGLRRALDGSGLATRLRRAIDERLSVRRASRISAAAEISSVVRPNAAARAEARSATNQAAKKPPSPTRRGADRAAGFRPPVQARERISGRMCRPERSAPAPGRASSVPCSRCWLLVVPSAGTRLRARAALDA